MRRVMAILLQEKNFGTNVINYVFVTPLKFELANLKGNLAGEAMGI